MTCLKCGHQIELAHGPNPRVSCPCGLEFNHPAVVNTGTRPSARAAERSRYRAFRAAGVVKNVGGLALGISLLGILFFPLGLVGAAIGIYVLIMLKGPQRRYSGRGQAMTAVMMGAGVFVLEGALLLQWMERRHLQNMATVQRGAAEDLKRLLRAQRLHRATEDAYGAFSDFRFRPAYGTYTLYLGLGPGEMLAARRDEQEVWDPLPEAVTPMVEADAFTAVAVANIDNDPGLDVWVLTHDGRPRHVFNDAIEETAPALMPLPTLDLPVAVPEAALPEVAAGTPSEPTPEPRPSRPTATAPPASDASASPAPASSPPERERPENTGENSSKTPAVSPPPLVESPATPESDISPPTAEPPPVEPASEVDTPSPVPEDEIPSPIPEEEL